MKLCLIQYVLMTPVYSLAPTGSGKTAIFELAILKTLRSMPIHNEGTETRRLAVYLAPTKVRRLIHLHVIAPQLIQAQALCSERFHDWKTRFSPLGLTCLELTGDTAEGKGFAAESRGADIIITTVGLHTNRIALSRRLRQDPLTNKAGEMGCCHQKGFP